MFVKQNYKDVGCRISSFQQDDKFTDINLVVENQVFSGHKLILASVSPYFETMFSTELSEKNKNSIELYGLKKGLFKQMFDYIYNRKLEINENNVEELLEGSNMLQLSGLTSSCCKFLKKKLNEKNVIGIYRLADIYSSTESLLSLKRKCKFFIEEHFLNMIKNEDFLDLPFHLFETLLKSESLNIHNELDVFKSCINWIQKEPELRIKHVYQLMKYVRLPIIQEDKKQNLIETIKSDELKIILKEILNQDLKKNQLIENDDLKFKHNEEFKNLISTNLRWKKRIMCSDMIYLIGGRSDNSAISDIIRINSFDFKLFHLKRMQISRFNHQSVELNGLLYIAGGQTSTQFNLKLVETFDLYENEKVNTSFMINSRSDFGLISYNNCLLAFGGSIKYPNSVERYDPVTNQWSIFDKIDDLPVRGFRIVKVNNLVYIIGGMNKFNQLLNQTLVYDPETKKVRRRRPMNESRSSFGCILMHNMIYCVGGSSSITAERYSIEKDYWSYITELNRPVENCCVTTAFNKLLIIGGENPVSKQPTNLISSFDAENGKWSQFSKNLPFNITSSSLVKI